MDERITGRTASPGYAAGRVHLLDLLTQAGTQIYPDPEGDQAPDIPLEPAVGDPTTGSPEAKVPASRDAASRQPAGEPATRNPTAEADLLVGAMQVAVDEVRALIALLDVDATLNRDAIGILGFQLAFMQDEALAAPALQAIAGGRSAVEAWRTALNDQIRWYQTAEDEYFRARASDLGDIRDRVLACLQRGGSSDADDWLAAVPQGALLVARDLPPSRFLAIEPRRLGALLLLQGSPASHVAMLARARGLPMIVALGQDGVPPREWQGLDATVDANRGEVVLRPGAQTLAAHAACLRREAAIDAAAENLRLKSARTADGVPIRICINLSHLDELDGIDPASCDGIGLARTEFLFQGHGGLPDEQTQYLAYRRMLGWAGGRIVTIRTLDAGGDKPIVGLTMEGELNPFLGVRGLRLSFAREDVFRVQLRALARAACHGEVRMMVPMVTVPHELVQVRRMLEEELEELARAGVRAARPLVGMMVEVPAAALMAATFDADFFSIGSNDLAQYVSAVGRDVGSLADLASPTQPAMLRLIGEVVEAGRRRGIETSLCGDAASDPDEIAALLASGLRTLSVAPTQLPRVKLAVAGARLAPERLAAG